MLSAGSQDVIQQHPPPAALSLPSSAVVAPSVSSPVGSVSGSTSGVAQPPSAWRGAAVTGRQSHLTSNSSSAAGALRSGGLPVVSTAERDSRGVASKAAPTAVYAVRDQCQVVPASSTASVRRSDVSGNAEATVVDGNDAASSQPGRLSKPSSQKLPASTDASDSLSAGQIKDISSTSAVHQRPFSSNQHTRPTTHRSAFSGVVTSTTTGTSTDAAQKPSATSSVLSSKPAGLSQDVEKAVSASEQILCKNGNLNQN